MRVRIWLAFLVAAGCLLDPAAAAADAERSSHPLQDARVATLREFVAERTGYPPIPALPSLRIVDAGTLDSAIGPAVAMEGGTPWAAYAPARHAILLHENVELDSVVGRSYLVHELVHAHQVAAGARRSAPCPGVLEGEAYRVQARYLRAHGAPDRAFILRLIGTLQAACGRFYRE